MIRNSGGAFRRRRRPSTEDVALDQLDDGGVEEVTRRPIVRKIRPGERLIA
jgi:hypothetical protein